MDANNTRMKDQESQTYSDAVLASEWEAEIAKRVEEIVSGQVKGVPTEEVHRKMQKCLNGGSERKQEKNK